MSSPTQDYIGQAGNPLTQGLGRLCAQYAKSPSLQTLISGVGAMANDLELLFQRVQRYLNPLDDTSYTPDGGITYPVNIRVETVLHWSLASDGVTPAVNMSAAMVSQAIHADQPVYAASLAWTATGSPIGTLGLQCSSDGLHWDTVSLATADPPVTQPAGTAGSTTISEDDFLSAYVRLTYTPSSGGTGAVLSGSIVAGSGAVGAQLATIGRIVGVTNVVPAAGLAPGPQTLTDDQYLKLVNAKIFRNFVRGGSTPQLLESIQMIMPDLTSASAVVISEIGYMTTLIAIGRSVENWEAGIFAIPSGQRRIKGAILPRPDGVALLTFWQNAGCFGFSSSIAPGTPLFPGALGFNSDPASTTGHWARSF